MRSKFIGAAAAVAIMASGLGSAMAQTPPSQQPPAQAQPSPAMPSQTPPSTAPATPSTPAPDSSNSMMQMQPKSDAAATPAAEHPKHQMSGCQKAILASKKALNKSQASPDTIAQAWQHIESAKQEKGQACKDEAKQAQEML